jgi:hypothetical protein
MTLLNDKQTVAPRDAELSTAADSGFGKNTVVEKI